MDENKKNDSRKKISTDALKKKLQANIERQDEAEKKIVSELSPDSGSDGSAKVGGNNEYIIEKSDNPYENMSLQELLDAYMPGEDLKFLDGESDSPDTQVQTAETTGTAADVGTVGDEFRDYGTAKKGNREIDAAQLYNNGNVPRDYAVDEQPLDDNVGQNQAANSNDEVEINKTNNGDNDDADLNEIEQLVELENNRRATGAKKQVRKRGSDVVRPSTAAREVNSAESGDLDNASTREIDRVRVGGRVKRPERDADVNASTRVMQTVHADDAADDATATDAPAEPDDTDLKLMMAFGMDDELTNTTTVDKINEIESDIDHDSIDEKGAKRERKAWDNAKAVHEEFVSPTQVSGIFAEYRKKYNLLLLRMLGAILLLIISFIFENTTIFGKELPEGIRMSIFPVVHVMLDLQLVVLACALIYRQLIDGVTALIKLKPVPESMTALIVILSLVYELAACFAKTNTTLRMYGFTVVFCVFLTLMFEYFNTKREIQCFNVVASKRVKYAITSIEGENAALEKEAFKETLPDDAQLFKISKTSFVDGFFKKFQSEDRHKKMLDIFVPVTLGAFVLFFIVGLVYTKQFYSAMSQAYVSALISMPFSLFVTYSYPFFLASAHAYSVESAIIGEESLNKYSHASMVSFDDKDVFPAYGVKVRSVKVYDENRLDHIIYNAASVFIKIGGPLAEVFEVATHDLGHSENVDVVSVEANGIEAVIDGSHTFIGKEAYLRSKGFTVRHEQDDTDDEGGEICVMYMIVNDEVAAKMCVQYVIDPDFEPLLKQLYKIGVSVGIKTFDPNINDQMLSARIRISKYPVKILKVKSADDAPDVEERIDSGIVSKNSAKSLMQALSLCERVTSATKSDIIVKIFSVVVSIIVALLILVLGGSTSVPSFYLALYQLFWIVPIVFITKVTIGKL